MSNSVLSQPHPKGRNGRNGFDLSFHRSYTSPLGALLPVFTDIALPGDKYKLNTSTFVRTEPLEKAAFARFKHRVDWFFVPMQQLYSRWNEFYNQTNDVMSSIYLQENPNSDFSWPKWHVFPTMGKFLENSITDFSTFTEAFGEKPATVTFTVDEYGVPKIWNFRRLWDMLGYGSLTRRFAPHVDNEKNILLYFLAYHKIFHSHYLPTQWFSNNPALYNVDKYFTTPDISLTKEDISAMVGILCTMHYRPYRKDYFTNIMPSPLWNNSFSNSISQSFLSSDSLFSSAVNPEARYGVSAFDPTNNVLNNYSLIADGDFVSSQSSVNLSAVGPQTGSNNRSLKALSTADLRAMYAFDRILRVTAFAGSHYQDQVLAHYGVKIPEGISDEAYFLGSQVMDVQVSEVVATSSTGAMEDNKPLSGSTLGDLAGKGFGSSGRSKDINFTCPCDGIIMGIQSIELIPDYSSMFMQRQTRYTSSLDFYHPEFDGLGMQPLVTDMFGFDPVNSNTVLGWQYRYSELKTNVDICNEGFWDTDRHTWAPTKQSVIVSPGDQAGDVLYDRAFNFFIFPQTANNIFLKKYPFYSNTYETKKAVDNIEHGYLHFASGLSGSQKCYENDPFLISMDIKAFKTSIMSVFSLDKVL